MSSAEQKTENVRGQKTGTVMAISGTNTIRVHVENLVKHPLYGKFIKRRTKIQVHDQASQAKVGDLVEVVPCRPISKTKRWRLLRIVRSNNA